MKITADDRRARTQEHEHAFALVLLVAFAVVGYTHVVYPVAMRVIGRRRNAPPPSRGDATLPTMTVVIPAFNEEEFIERKIDDTLGQDYPREKLSIIVADDGSTDATAAIARRKSIRVVGRADRTGKCDAINRAVPQAPGEIVCFTDANGSLAPGSLRAVAAAFDDPRVAVVSGTKRAVGTGTYATGEGFYWRLENGLKEAESKLGCTMGADGGIYAARRSQFREIPPDTIADDLDVPFGAIGRGLMVRHASDAIAHEEVSPSIGAEFERRTRIATGVWQAIVHHRRLASPRRGMVAVAFVSHRVLRTAVVPGLLPVCWIGCGVLARSSRLAKIGFIVQTACWGAAGAGTLMESRILGVPLQFALTNAASIRGGARYLSRRQSTAWRRTQRGRWVPGPSRVA